MENYTFTITVKDIYGTENPEIPKGYKVVGFRPPNTAEWILDWVGKTGPIRAAKDDWTGHPRLILEKLPEKRRYVKDVSRCLDCPHHGYLYERGHVCIHTAARKIDTNAHMNIPEWCPLPIAK